MKILTLKDLRRLRFGLDGGYLVLLHNWDIGDPVNVLHSKELHNILHLLNHKHLALHHQRNVCNLLHSPLSDSLLWGQLHYRNGLFQDLTQDAWVRAKRIHDLSVLEDGNVVEIEILRASPTHLHRERHHGNFMVCGHMRATILGLWILHGGNWSLHRDGDIDQLNVLDRRDVHSFQNSLDCGNLFLRYSWYVNYFVDELQLWGHDRLLHILSYGTSCCIATGTSTIVSRC